MFKNKRTVAIQVISLAAAVLLLFSALPLFTACSDSQKSGATCATAGKSAAQPVNAGNAAISGTVAQTKNTTAEKAVPPSAVREVF